MWGPVLRCLGNLISPPSRAALKGQVLALYLAHACRFHFESTGTLNESARLPIIEIEKGERGQGDRLEIRENRRKKAQELQQDVFERYAKLWFR